MKKCKKAFNGLSAIFSVGKQQICIFVTFSFLAGLILIITGFAYTHVRFQVDEFPYFGLFFFIPLELLFNICISFVVSGSQSFPLF
jgi:hypothetical protein